MKQQAVLHDQVSHTVMISAYDQGNCYYSHSQALELSRAMEWQGVVADHVVYNALVSACEKATRLD